MKRLSNRIIGVMSGSSLDGLDVAWCSFEEDEQGTLYWDVLDCESLAADDIIFNRLKKATSLEPIDLLTLHADYGKWMGEQIKQVMDRKNWNADALAVHGHTIFHFPSKGVSLQLGQGAYLAAAIGIPAIVDFRSSDLAEGGEGAPMVPIAERDLWKGYKLFINLGGIANISIHTEDGIKAWDVGPCNQLLNHLAGKLGQAFDRDGSLAGIGKVNEALLESWLRNSYHQQQPPKSLDNGWIIREVIPVLNKFEALNIHDQLRTAVEYIALSLAQDVSGSDQIAFVTGGGAHNTFLMERICACSGLTVVHLDKRTIDFKEAIMMAYAGWLRWHNQPNFIPSVTGARKPACGGVIYLPF